MSYPGNNNCDNDKCISKHGPVRKLRLNGDSNAILCHHCFLLEMAFRRDVNKDLAKDCQWSIPEWTDLELYEGC